MITTRRFCSPAWTLVLWALLAVAPSTQAQQGQDSPEQKKQPSQLAQFYGFGPMEILKLEWKLSEPIIADINGDGLNDLIVVNNHKARIDLLLQKKGFDPEKYVPVEVIDEDVNDLFGREKTWRFKRVSYDLNVEASSLTVCDLNGDGLLDLAYYANDGLRIVLQHKPEDPEALAASKDQAAQPPDSPREPLWNPAKKIDITDGVSSERALATGDLNNDGRKDLALLAGDGVWVILQKNDGEMAQPEKYPTSGQQPKQLDIVDVNQDRLADLVVITSEQDLPVTVRCQSPEGKLGPELCYDLPSPRILEISNLGQEDHNYFLSVGRISGRLQIYALAPNPQDKEYPVMAYPLPTTSSAENRDIVAADVDGDGLSDVVVSDPSRAEFLLFRAAAHAGLAVPQSFPGLTDMRKLLAGDLDGSGRDSIVVLSPEEKIIAITRMSKGRLSFPESVSIIDEPQVADLADINGDKQLDLVYVARDKKEKKYYLRTLLSIGRDNSQTGPQIELTELKDKPLDLKTADIDHDSLVDVMVINPFGPMLLVRQEHPGEFTQVTKQDIYSGLVADIQPGAVSLEPLGPQGGAALLLAKKNFARSVFFDAQKGWQVLDQYQTDDTNSNLSAATTCKLPGSAASAIVTYDAAEKKLLILTPQDDGTYRQDRQIKIGAISAKKILARNFGGPSSLSLLVGGTHKLILVPVVGQSYLLENLASFESNVKDPRYGALAAGDINSDGLPEILLIDQAHGSVEILAFDDKGEPVRASKFKAFEQPNVDRYERNDAEPSAVCLGDVTGDGKNDLILLVHDRIIIYPQD